MSSHYEFRQIGPRRKVAIAVALLCVVVFIVWILPEWTRTPFQPIAIVEIARATLPSTSAWSDERHFRFVAWALGALLIIQSTGLLLALSSYK